MWHGSHRAPRVLSAQVRRAVWQRDEGCCAACGDREGLQFAQVVPVGKLVGRLAASVAAYLELRCGACVAMPGRTGPAHRPGFDLVSG